MKKILHIAANTAQELLHTAVKLVNKLASLVLRGQSPEKTCGQAAKRPVPRIQDRHDRLRRAGRPVLSGLAADPEKGRLTALSPYTTGRCAQRISLKQRSAAKL